jgi:hypothetical protein
MAVSLSIVSEFAGKGVATAIQQFKQLDGTTQKAAFTFKKLLIPGAIAATGAIVAFTKGVVPAVNAASDLEESMSKNNVIFGDAASAVSSFADEAARALGQSKTQALAAASTFGTFGKAAGLAGQELATFSTDFVTLASDLASFNNTTPEDAINAIGAALRGESEPLRRYGVLLNDATLKAAALELGIYDGTGALTAQQKVLAAQKVIYEQTTDAQGDFARTSDGLANQQRILAAQVENLQAKFGELLLPVFKRVVQYINDNVLPALNLMIDGFKDDGLSGAIVYFAAAFGDGSTDILIRVRDLILGFIELEKKFVKLAAPLFVLIDLGRAFVDMLSGGDGVITIEQQLIDRTDEVNAMFDKLIGRVDAAKYRLDLFRNSAVNVNNALVDTNARMENFGQKVKAVVPAAEEAEQKTGGLGKTVDLAAEKAKKMADRVKELSDALETEMADALKGAEDNLALAEKAFDDFAGSVSSVIEDTIDFAAALEKSGEEGGKSFFDELQDQADRAKEFGILVEKLLAAGLSEQALNEVLAAGVDAGTSIAKELLGSAEGVLRANKLVEETQKIATAIGQAAAAKFYQAGVDNGQAYLRGVEEAIAAANARIAGAKRPADIKGAQALFGASVGTAGKATGVVNNYNIVTETIDPSASARAVQNALIEANKLYGPLDIQIAF